MRLLWYPEYSPDNSSSSVWKSLRKDLAKRHDLMLLVEAFLKKLAPIKDLAELQKSEEIFPVGEGLWEMRIPKTRKGGVVRIYFCYKPDCPETLVLLEAELKHDKAGSGIPSARQRQTQYYEKLKRKPR